MAEPSRHDVLSGVVPASSMPVFAHERLLPVPGALRTLFSPSAGSHETSPVGLVRGQTVVCAGSAAMSCALGLAAGVTQAGSWVAFVGLPSTGLQAAAGIGVSLERAVFVSRLDRSSPVDGSTAATHDVSARHVSARHDSIGRSVRGDDTRGDAGAVLSTLVDGVDLVVISRHLVSSLSSSLIRRLQSRAQSKGSILVIVGEPPSISMDLRLTARAVHWEGMGEGYGYLRRRLVSIATDGRRSPRRRDHVVWLPDATGGMSAVDDTSATEDVSSSRRSPTTSSEESTGAVVISLRGDRHVREYGT